MTAVDTNVLVRLLTADEPKQAAAARALFAKDQIWIAKSVWLETCWVLTSLYEFDESAVCGAFKKLLGLANVQTEDPPAITAALAFAEKGLEFADALHLNSRAADSNFATFDQAFAQRARRAGEASIVKLAKK